MAVPLQNPKTQSPSTTPRTAKTVVAVKEVTIALVEYIDNEGLEQKQFALVGDNSVHLLSGKQFGFSNTVAQGPAVEWLKNGIFEKLGRKK